MGKLSFFVGAGIGYLLGARAGRQQFEKIRSASQSVWENPRVQSGVHRVEEKVSQVAKEQAAAMTDKVADTVKSRITGDSSSSAGSSTGGGSSPMPPTPPQPEA